MQSRLTRNLFEYNVQRPLRWEFRHILCMDTEPEQLIKSYFAFHVLFRILNECEKKQLTTPVIDHLIIKRKLLIKLAMTEQSLPAIVCNRKL